MKKYQINLFLALLLIALVSCKKGGGAGSATPPEETTPQEDVKILVTTSNRSVDLETFTTGFSEKSNMSPSTIKLEPDQRFQEMDGFGAAITGSVCYNLMQMSAANRKEFLEQTFSTEKGLGMSYVRISIGASDFSLSEYTLCDAAGIENFGLTSEEIDYIIPVLKEILDINPDLKIMGTPWTPPRWMKVNNLDDLQSYNSWTGGQLNPAYYEEYAAYFLKWIEAFNENGIGIYSITPQNEPLNRGNSVSLFMGWEEELDFVGNHLSPVLKEAGLTTKIYLFDHNYNYDNIPDQNDYPAKIYAAGIDDEMVAGAAYHNYGGDKSELLDIHDKYPDRELVFTETSIGTWNDGRNLEARLLTDMNDVGIGTINNWCKAVIVWNLMLDSDRGPNRDGGCQTCYGAVDIDKTNYSAISRNSHYYMIGHLSSVVKPGATRIGTSGFSDAGFNFSAFQNSDGSYAVVLTNSNDSKKQITIDDGENHFSYEVPAKSIVSYLWKK